MKTGYQPVLITIVYGLAGAAAFVPATLILNVRLGQTMAIGLVLWALTAGYGLLLVYWRAARWPALVFPLLLLLPPLAMGVRMAVYVYLLLGVLSWIRSGQDKNGFPGRALIREMVLCGAGSLLTAVLIPQTLTGLAMGIWAFFLIQSLHFAVPPTHTQPQPRAVPDDPFEAAAKKARKILTA